MDIPGIPQLPRGHYRINVSLDCLERQLEHYTEDYQLDLDPDYQRGHVWTRKQQIAFLEYILRGGEGGQEILFNLPRPNMPPMTLIDGKQRLTACLAFVHNEFPVFGGKYSDYGRLSQSYGLVFRHFQIPTRKELLEYYLHLNAGGTPHSKKEIARVRELLRQEEQSNG
jgi:hypothetical protein